MATVIVGSFISRLLAWGTRSASAWTWRPLIHIWQPHGRLPADWMSCLRHEWETFLCSWRDEAMKLGINIEIIFPSLSFQLHFYVQHDVVELLLSASRTTWNNLLGIGWAFIIMLVFSNIFCIQYFNLVFLVSMLIILNYDQSISNWLNFISILFTFLLQILLQVFLSSILCLSTCLHDLCCTNKTSYLAFHDPWARHDQWRWPDFMCQEFLWLLLCYMWI